MFWRWNNLENWMRVRSSLRGIIWLFFFVKLSLFWPRPKKMSRAESPQTEYNGTKLFISFYITNFESVFWKNTPPVWWILMILKSVGCSINYGKRNVQKKVLTFWSFFCFLARPFVSFVSHIARYAPSSTDKSLSLKNQKSTQPNFYPPCKWTSFRR